MTSKIKAGDHGGGWSVSGVYRHITGAVRR